MRTSDFDYSLPPERIAQESAVPRDHSRLLVLDRQTGKTDHRRFIEIGAYLHAGDLLIVNESRVFKARLTSVIARSPTTKQSLEQNFALKDCRAPSDSARNDHSVEIFLIRPDGTNWIALAKPGKKVTAGKDLTFADGTTAHVVEKRGDGTIVINFGSSTEDVLAWTDRVGSVPVPPYIKPTETNQAEYQTVYAKTVGSVAAPTAGFHFTPELIATLKANGIRFATVTLHVGLGTFKPITGDTLAEHTMHEEWIEVPEETRKLITETKKNNKRVIAVGTTSVRALESGIDKGFTNVFITPGYRFKVIDGLITNFHLPKSTLIVLVSAFAGEHHEDPDAGRRTILAAYDEALKNNYRFASFGDAMFIV